MIRWLIKISGNINVILDPFIGSGQTAIAALKSQRIYIGYEIESTYVDLANKRISEFSETLRKKKLDTFLPITSTKKK